MRGLGARIPSEQRFWLYPGFERDHRPHGLASAAPYVSVLERGARRPMPSVLFRAAAELSLPIAELLVLAGHPADARAWPPEVLVELALGRPIDARGMSALRRCIEAG